MPYKNKEDKAKYQRKYRKLNKDKVRATKAKYYINNKNIIIKKSREYEKKELKTNIQLRLRKNLRCRLYQILRNNYKCGSAVNDLGCSIDDFKKYIESKFLIGMSWDNYGEWHLDHIKPLSKFDLENRDEFLIACHYTNYQPLWAKDNIRKGNR